MILLELTRQSDLSFRTKVFTSTDWIMTVSFRNRTYLWLVLIPAILSGCATGAQYRFIENLKTDDLLYTNAAVPEKFKAETRPEELLRIAQREGIDKIGYVGPDTSTQFIELNKAFPVIPHTDEAYEEAVGQIHKMRLGQAAAFYADSDIRTSGFIKDRDGRAISLSGFFEATSPTQTSEGLGRDLAGGAIAGAVSGAMTINSVNAAVAPQGLQLSAYGREAVMGGQVALGFAAGAIASAIRVAIDSQRYKDAVQALTRSSSLSEAMNGAGYGACPLPTTPPLACYNDLKTPLPGMSVIGSEGSFFKEKPIVVAPGVIKRFLILRVKRHLDFSEDFVIATVVGTYRGPNFEEKFPRTNGWNYQISNLAKITLKATDLKDPETTYFALKSVTKGSKIF
jgi:hypothetical protein